MALPASEVDRLRAMVRATPQNMDLQTALVCALLDGGEKAEAQRSFEAFVPNCPPTIAYCDVGVRLYEAVEDHIRAARFRRKARNLQVTTTSDPTRHPSRSSHTSHAVNNEPRRHLSLVRDDLGTAGPAVVVSTPTERLSDVMGLAKVKSILENVLDSTKSPAHSGPWLGGALLYGPPSCGKHFAARVLAGELGAQLWTVNLAAAGAVSSVLSELRPALGADSSEPQVIFLEHLDAAPGHVDQHAGALLSGLVPLLDGAPDNVVIIGAATYPWLASPLVVRPGRLSKVLLVLPPDRPARQRFLTLRLQDAPRAAREEVDWLLDHTEGYSFGDLDDLLGIAHRVAETTSQNYKDLSHAAFRKARQAASPGSAEWLTVAGHHAMMNQQGGLYDDLLEYFHQRESPRPPE